MRALLLITAFGCGFARAASPLQAPQPPPGTDIYLVPVTGGLLSMKAARPMAVASAAGYDNQPNFSPDGGRILFAANRDGKQIDVFVFERASGRVSQLTQTAENENSPTYLPDGVGAPGGFSVVRTEADRTQRLWRFDVQGRNPRLVLADIKPVGYHAWVDRDRLALFVLGKPATLQIASVASGTAEVAAEGIGRSLHRIPGIGLVSFVHREASGDLWVKTIDIASKKIEPLVKAVDGNVEKDMVWMPDGKTMLMSGGTKVFSWTAGAAGWTEVFDAAPHNLGTVSRLAVSPQADAVAIVVAEPRR